MLSLFLSLFLLLFFPSFQSRYLQTCSPSCATCSSPPSEYLSNCDSCAPTYAAIKDNTSQCLLITGAYEHYYYNHITNLFEECYSNCKTCSGRPDMGACITCIDNNYKKFETDMCFGMQMLAQGYYLSDIDHTFHSCYQSCLTCTGQGTKTNHSCSTCNNYYDYHYIKGARSMCYFPKLIPSNYYLNTKNSSDSYYDKCSEHCLTCKYNEDIEEDEHICQRCPSGTYIYKEENTCVSECPQGYIVNTVSNECDVKPKENFTEFLDDIQQNVVDLSKNQGLLNSLI